MVGMKVSLSQSYKSSLVLICVQINLNWVLIGSSNLSLRLAAELDRQKDCQLRDLKMPGGQFCASGRSDDRGCDAPKTAKSSGKRCRRPSL